MRTRWLVLAGMGCGYETDIRRPEDAPVATIAVPTDGSEVPIGRAELLGLVSDAVDDADRLFAIWSVGPSVTAMRDVCSGFALADGTTRCTTSLEGDDALVRLVVKDVAGFEGQAFADVTVLDVAKPFATLIEPAADGGPHFQNVPIAVRAQIGDGTFGVDDLTVTWSTEQIGAVEGPVVASEDGELIGQVMLPQGEHGLTVTVANPDGERALDRQIVWVGADNLAPTPTILEPASPVGVLPGTSLSVRVTAQDDHTTTDALEVQWSSDRDGALGGGPIGETGVREDVLWLQAAGVHGLTATVVDGQGAEGLAPLQAIVDTPPSCTLTAPLDDAQITRGAPVAITGRTVDDRDGSALLRWTAVSDVDGPLAGGVPTEDGAFSVTLSTLASFGPHTLTLTCTDSLGLSAVDQVDVLVVP